MMKKISFLLMSVLTLTSCDRDSFKIEGDVFGEDSFKIEKQTITPLSVEIEKTNAVSVKNLPYNILGFHKDVFGSTKAHLVTQVSMDEDFPMADIGDNVTLESVYLYLPFDTDAKGEGNNKQYILKNVYGSGKFKLDIYENGVFLRNQDPNNNFENQDYYSNEMPFFNTHKKSNSIGSTEVSALNKTVDIGNEKLAPGIYVALDKLYFQDRFFNNNLYKTLKNNSSLRGEFRGFIFQTSALGNDNLISRVLLEKGKMVFVYQALKDGKQTNAEYKLDMGYFPSTEQKDLRTNITVNLFENSNSNEYTQGLNSNSKLWLKGNEGSLAKINIISNEDLKALRDKKILINQAVLTLTVDESVNQDTNTLPNRLYLYDLTNNQPLKDYLSDTSTSPVKSIYNGLLDKSGGTPKYRFRITNHLNDLISSNTENVQLGLAVTNDISKTDIVNIKNNTLKKAPISSVTMPFGVVLNGLNTSGDKAVKLEVFYTSKK